MLNWCLPKIGTQTGGFVDKKTEQAASWPTGSPAAPPDLGLTAGVELTALVLPSPGNQKAKRRVHCVLSYNRQPSSHASSSRSRGDVQFRAAGGTQTSIAVSCVASRQSRESRVHLGSFQCRRPTAEDSYLLTRSGRRGVTEPASRAAGRRGSASCVVHPEER